MKVVPSEVEEVVVAAAGVLEVKVYAGQRCDSQYVKAAVVGNGNLDVASIRAHCEKHLVYYKRPETIHVLPSLSPTVSALGSYTAASVRARRNPRREFRRKWAVLGNPADQVRFGTHILILRFDRPTIAPHQGLRQHPAGPE